MSNQWDILIVGAGTTGMPAAIKASERGAKILVIDVADQVGGTLHLSAGSFSGAGSKLQKSKGIEDTPEKHFQECLRINHGTGDFDKMRMWQDNAGETLDWLMDLGLEYPEDQPMAAAGHEPYETARISTPVDGGRGYLRVLKTKFEEVIDSGSVELRLNAKMTNLLVEADGSVSGIHAENEQGKQVELRAAITLLACGGYSNSDALWKEFHNRPKRGYAYRLSNGDGIQAARKLGAQVQLGENLMVTFGGTIDIDSPEDYWIHTLSFPDMRPPWEIYVNQDGRRFMNEENTSQDFRERTIVNQPDWLCWVIYDQAIRDESSNLFQVFDNAWNDEKIARAFDTHPDFCKADSIEDLAEQTGMPFNTLKTTIEQYNKGREVDSDSWGRKHTPLPIEKPPFYAIKHYGIAVCGFAGIVCDNQLRILDANGAPIPNLYAGGEILGMGLWGNAFLGGSSIGGCLTMGRLLGERFLSWETASAAAAE